MELKNVRNIETLAAGYTHEGSIDIKNDVPTGGVINVTLASSQLAGKIGKASIIVDEIVPKKSTSGTTYTGYTVIMGDDGDTDGLIASAELAEDQTPVAAGTILTNTGDDVYLAPAIDNLDITFTASGETDEALANGGKIRVLLEYYPTAGAAFGA
tara:strand:- start:5691 stop:6158 length:468 start_codon:yes stop_codon:yes gene_type:complete